MPCRYRKTINMTHVWYLVSSRHARSVFEFGGPPPLLRTCMQVRVISAQQTFRHLLRDVLKPLRLLRYLLLKLSSMHSTEGTNANEPFRWNPTRRSAEGKAPEHRRTPKRSREF